jgi:carboxylate-amine ligase
MIRSFRPSPPTVGVELEWQLVDEGTLDLRDAIMPLIEVLSGDPYIKPEMIQPAVETITPPAESTAALRPGLVDVVVRVVDAADRFGLAVVGAGTHPFCDRTVPITPLPRYLEMERTHGYLAHAYVVYSLQTHVGMPSGEVAVRVMRDLRGFVPVLLALSGSSPFFHGYATPFASYRQRVLATARSCGMPPAFQDWKAFVDFLDTAERASMFGSFRDMHWDVRLRPDLGTIEVRVMDAQPTIARSLALAAVVHSLLVHLTETTTEEQRPALARPLPWWLEKENAFRASHDGMGAWLVCDPHGAVRPLRELAEELFDLVAPTARRLGEDGDLARARDLLDDPCCRRQLAIFRSTGSTREVVRVLANELRDELARPRLDPYDASDVIGAP